MFPNDLAPLPPFATWIMASIAMAFNDGDTIDKDVVHMSMLPTLETMSYQAVYVYGNHIHVISVEEHLTISDYGVMATFEQECVSSPNDQRSVLAKLEYVGWVEEILELNYGVLNTIVLLCNWVKVNYIGNSAIVKRNECGFTLMNLSSLISISNQSFAFPLHVEQVFFF